ncbi:MAG: GNAT family N-acetyltransferase [Cyanobacteria bacterium J06597_1]
MPSEYTIAAATVADLADVSKAFDAYRQFYRQPPDLEGAMAFIRDRLTQASSRILVARNSENSLAGFTQVYPSFSSVRMQPIWILNDLFVYPDYRRQGVARVLMEAARTLGHSHGVASLVLATETTNAAAQSLYRSLDYVPDKQFVHFQLSLQ